SLPSFHGPPSSSYPWCPQNRGRLNLPADRQVATDERSGPRAADDQVLLDASLEYTEFVAAGVARPARRRKGRVPARGIPHPQLPPRLSRPTTERTEPPHLRHRRRPRSWLSLRCVSPL